MQDYFNVRAIGMSYLDIAGHISEIYGLDFSNANDFSAVTDKLIPEIKLWQQRPLDSHHPFVWLMHIHYKVKQDGRYAAKAWFTRFWGLILIGRKEIRGLYLSETEGAKLLAQRVHGPQQSRPARHPAFACVDGLTGFPEAINAIFPQTEVQLCVIATKLPQFSEICSQQKPEGIHG